MTSVTHAFAASDAITADDMNDNLGDLAAALDALTNANIASGAGITSDKLADRYAPSEPCFTVVPYQTGASWTSATATGTAARVPTTDTCVYRTKFCSKSGLDAYLVQVDVYADFVAADTAVYPRLTFKVNGTTIGGGPITLDNSGDPNGFYRLALSSPFDNPLFALADGDNLEVFLGASANNPYVAGLTVKPTIKHEHTS